MTAARSFAGALVSVASVLVLSATTTPGAASPIGLFGPADPDNPKALLFSGFDIWRHGRFTHAGVVLVAEGA